MDYPEEQQMEADEMERCGDLPQNGHTSCTRTYGHDGRHIQHDKTTGKPAYGWRTGSYAPFSMSDKKAFVSV